MIKKSSIFLLLMFCCTFLSGCTVKNSATPEMTSNGTKIKELQSEYQAQNEEITIEKKYTYENNQLKINLR